MIGRLRTHLQIIMKFTSNFKYFICKKINYKSFFDDFYVKYFLILIEKKLSSIILIINENYRIYNNFKN